MFYCTPLLLPIGWSAPPGSAGGIHERRGWSPQGADPDGVTLRSPVVLLPPPSGWGPFYSFVHALSTELSTGGLLSVALSVVMSTPTAALSGRGRAFLRLIKKRKNKGLRVLV